MARHHDLQPGRRFLLRRAGRAVSAVGGAGGRAGNTDAGCGGVEAGVAGEVFGVGVGEVMVWCGLAWFGLVCLRLVWFRLVSASSGRCGIVGWMRGVAGWM